MFAMGARLSSISPVASYLRSKKSIARGRLLRMDLRSMTWVPLPLW